MKNKATPGACPQTQRLGWDLLKVLSSLPPVLLLSTILAFAFLFAISVDLRGRAFGLPQNAWSWMLVVFVILLRIILLSCPDLFNAMSGRHSWGYYLVQTLVVTACVVIGIQLSDFVPPSISKARTAHVEESRELHASPLVNKDGAVFIDDVTIPDDTVVSSGAVLLKRWKIQNVGDSVWIGRSMRRREGPGSERTIRSDSLVPIPDTRPDENAVIEAKIIAPVRPGRYTANWEMIDASGKARLFVENPLFTIIQVRDR
jgi:hypothetical protein